MSDNDKGNGVQWSKERDQSAGLYGFQKEDHMVKWRRALWVNT